MPDVGPIDFFDPRGRVNRAGLILMAAVLIGAQSSLYGSKYVTGMDPLPVVVVAFETAFAWLGFVAVSKRLHDLGYSAWRLITGIAALVAATVVTSVSTVVLFGEDVMLPGGPGYLAVAAVVFLPTIAAAIWLHCAPGEAGENRFGPAPDATGLARAHPAKRNGQQTATAPPNALNSSAPPRPFN